MSSFSELAWQTLTWLWDALAVVGHGGEEESEPEPPMPAELWAEALEAAGLTGVEVSGPRGPVAGRAGPITVTIQAVTRDYVISIGGLELDAREFYLRTEDLDTAAMKGLGMEELETGDPVFDRSFFVRGEPRLVLGLLDAETRRLLLGTFLGAAAPPEWAVPGLLLENVSLKRGRLEARLPRLAGRAPRADLIRTLLGVVQRLSRPADLAYRLGWNARKDPLPAVRRVNLEVLVLGYPGRPATLETLRMALADPAPEVRLRAAIELGAEGRDTVREIASAGSGPEGPQSEAIRVLGARWPTASVQQALDQALRARRTRVARECLSSLGQRGGPAVVEPLAKVLAVERGRLAVAAAAALGASGEAPAEGPLIAALDRRDEGVAVAAAEALGLVGTASAVPRLRELESSSPDQGLRRAVREAVAEIQARLSGASPGQLSLAGGASGQLSLPEGEAGRVSLSGDVEAEEGDDEPSAG